MARTLLCWQIATAVPPAWREQTSVVLSWVVVAAPMWGCTLRASRVPEQTSSLHQLLLVGVRRRLFKGVHRGLQQRVVPRILLIE
jgi:hypothetical protein